MKRIIFNPADNLEGILKEHSSGTIFLCPICRSELQIAVTTVEANEKRMHPGMVCPKNKGHVCISFNTDAGSSLWRRLGVKK